MNFTSKALLVLALFGVLMPLTGAISVAYLPQTVGASQPSQVADILTGFSLVLVTMVIGKIIQWLIRMMNKVKRSVVGGGIR